MSNKRLLLVVSVTALFSFLYAERGAFEAFNSSDNFLGYSVLFIGFMAYFAVFLSIWIIVEKQSWRRLVFKIKRDKLKGHGFGILILTAIIICVYLMILPSNPRLWYNIFKDLLMYCVFFTAILSMYHYVLYCDEAEDSADKRNRLFVIGQNTTFATFFYGAIIVLLALFVSLDINHLATVQFSGDSDGVLQLEMHIMLRDILLGLGVIVVTIWFSISLQIMRLELIISSQE